VAQGYIPRGAARGPWVAGPPRYVRTAAHRGAAVRHVWRVRVRKSARARLSAGLAGLGFFTHDFLPKFELKCTGQ
jgi:hypothetical protein